MTTEKIAIKLTTTSYLTRWPCSACLGTTEKVSILAEYEDETVKLRVCERCLKMESAEPGFIDRQLEESARAFERDAAAARSLIGRLEVPSFADWQRRHEAYEVEWEKHYQARSVAKDGEVRVQMPDGNVRVLILGSKELEDALALPESRVVEAATEPARA